MAGNHIKHIFLILMENHNWSAITGSSTATYINGTLLPMSSYCTNYFNPAGNHPSEPNYIWLEAGTNALVDHTFATDNDPSQSNSTASHNHLSYLLTQSGHTWREYAEDLTANDCPVNSSAEGSLYAAKHVPFIFFQDVSGSPPSTSSATCTANVKPFSQLATDLQAGTVADYNFISPNLCDDMHGATGCQSDVIHQGDQWLAQTVPAIMNSSVYKDSAIFILWDEGTGSVSDGPIGMIAVSPFAKGGGYQATGNYDHSSTVRTVEEVFGLMPLLANATSATPLSDLFKTGMFP